jgi:M6 family metalloprotease-like protein
MRNWQFRNNNTLKALLLKFCFVLFLFAGGTAAVAAPYSGETFTYSQPNGETFKVRLWGDEFFAYQETEDGYLVVRDPHKGFYCYAQVLPDGSDIISTGVRVGHAKPAGLKPKQRLAKGKAFEKSLGRRALLGADERGRRVFPDLKGASKGQTLAGVTSSDTNTTLAVQQSLLYAPAPTGDGTTGVEPPTIQPAPPANPTVATRKGLVLLASFPDAQGEITKTPTQIANYFNAQTYTNDGNATSIYGYFNIESCGKLSYTNVVTAWFTATNNKSYYTDPNASGRAQELVKEGLAILSRAGFDFSQCDGNNDGAIDGVNVFYAGATVNGWSEGLWPHASGFYWDPIKTNGLTSSLVRYQMTDMPASLAIGTTCHENGHMICGFPDLYSYDGNAASIGAFSSGGNGYHPSHVDPYLRMHAGWLTPMDVNLLGQTNYTLTVDGTNIVRYVNPSNPKEYFLFEMRGETGYEGVYAGVAKNCPSKGLVIYHAKEDGSNTGSSIYTADSPNCSYSKPFELLVIEDSPSPATMPWYDDPSPDVEDAFDTGDVVVDTSTPDLAFWSSRGRTISAGICVSNIQVTASNVTFTIQNNNPPKITATPSVVSIGSNTTLTVQMSGSWTYAWTKVSGPGIATFGTPTAATTTASFNTNGAYVVRVAMSNGVSQVVSETTVIVSAGVKEYLGYYKGIPAGNNWSTGWVEVASSKLQWRNAAGASWPITNTANPDVFLTVNAWPYGAGLEFHFYRENAQVTKFTYNGGTFYRCNPIGINQSVATPKNVALGITLTASDADSALGSLTYSVVTQPANGTLSGTAPNLTFTPSTNFVGNTTFTFKVSDGTYTSNVAAVNISVYAPGGEPKYRLVVIGGNGDGEFRMGEQATITADAARLGTEFDTWFGDVGALANPNGASTTLTMPAADVIVTASYKPAEYLKEYVGYYRHLPVGDVNWDTGWVEFVGNQLQWRNPSGWAWNLLPSGQMDALVTDATCPYGAGKTNTFARQNGRIVSFNYLGWGTIYTRESPVASAGSAVTFLNVPVAVTLTAYDPQSNPMTYTVVMQPAHGALSGTNATLTYTPSTNFVGNDSFTFKASDGSNDSNVATISLKMLPALPPVVTNGAGAVSISSTSARLQGVLTAGLATNVWFCWGAADGGTTSTSNWQHVVPVGAVAEGVDFSNLVTGLSTNTTYFYRCYAANPYGSDWSDTVSAFSGTPVGGGVAWTPANIVAKAWYDAADTSTVLTSGSAVTSWNDKSGNANHATQGTAGSQPTYDSANKKLIFDGGDILKVTNDSFKNLQNFAIIVLQKWNASSSWNNVAASYNGEGTVGWQIRQQSTTYGSFTFTRRGTGGADDLTPTTTVNNSDFIGVGVRQNSTNVSIRHNGTVTLSSNSDTGSISYSGSNRSAIGGRYTADNWGTPGGYLNGELKEMVVIENATTGDVERCEGYLAHKWGMQGSLPTNHLYKSIVPGGAGLIGNLSPTGISQTAAAFNGSLYAFATNYHVRVYYGTTDGGSNAVSWASNAYVGSWSNVLTNVTYTATLQSGTTYYYTFMASNATGRAWAGPSWTFRTLGTPPAVTINHSVPHAWLSTINASWSTNYEAAVMADPDGDGYLTWQEYWSGTNPQDSNSFLRIDSIGFSGTNLLVSWRHAVVNAGIPPITIQARSNLVSGSWVGIGAHAPTNGINIWSAGSSVQGFYRLAVTNAP